MLRFIKSDMILSKHRLEYTADMQVNMQMDKRGSQHNFSGGYITLCPPIRERTDLVLIIRLPSFDQCNDLSFVGLLTMSEERSTRDSGSSLMEM